MTEQEFSQLVHEHKSSIYTVCYMFSKDEDEVNDLFQEILINLWRGIDSFKGEAKLSSWIYRISLNTCISADRKKKRALTDRVFKIHLKIPHEIGKFFVRQRQLIFNIQSSKIVV